MMEQDVTGNGIRVCGTADTDAMLAIVNAAAEAYRGVIPPDRWHEPYMPANELVSEIADGVTFSGYEADGRLVGVMAYSVGAMSISSVTPMSCPSAKATASAHVCSGICVATRNGQS